MKSSIKRFLSIIMVAAMVIAMVAACGSKKEDSTEPEETKTEASEKQTEETDVQEEEPETEEPDVQGETQEENVEMIEEQKSDQAERERLLGTEPIEPVDVTKMLEHSEGSEQQLYDMIEQSVREGYLDKYNIAPKDFTWPENIGGKGEPKPWGYFGERLRQKTIQLLGGESDDSNIEPETYYIDAQTAELMDCVCDGIAKWRESITVNAMVGEPLLLSSRDWMEIVTTNVTFE